MTKQLSSFFLASCALFAACGRPHAKAPEPTKLDLPDFRSPVSMGLREAQGDASFISGGLVIFDRAVSAPQIARLLTASRSFVDAYVADKKDATAFDATVTAWNTDVVAPSEAKAKAASDELASLDAQKDKRLYEIQLTSAQAWFENELNTVAEKVTEADLANARNLYSRYCEAKLFDFATSELLASSNFASRPTPTALCEGYYRKMAWFENSTLCQPNADGSPKNYFTCIWQAGILNSSFANWYSKDQKATITKAAENPNFAKIFAGNTDTGSCKFKRKGLARLENATRDTIVDYIRNGAVKYEYFDCNSVKVPFGFSAKPTTGSILETASPGALSDNVEALPNGVNDGFLFFPNKTAEKPPRILSKELVDFGMTISRRFGNFNRKACSENQKNRNLNTAKFVEPLIVPAIQAENCSLTDLDLPDIFRTDAALEQKRTENALLEDDVKMKKSRYAAGRVADCERTPAHPICVFQRAYYAKLGAAEDKGVALVLIKRVDLTFSPIADGGLAVSLILDQQQFGFGCVKSSTDGTSMDCPEALRQGKPNMSVTFDPKTRALHLERVIRDASTDKVLFQDATDKQRPEVLNGFPGRTLAIDLYLNQFENGLSYYSGKLWIRDGSTDLFQGSISYILDAAFKGTK